MRQICILKSQDNHVQNPKQMTIWGSSFTHIRVERKKHKYFMLISGFVTASYKDHLGDGLPAIENAKHNHQSFKGYEGDIGPFHSNYSSYYNPFRLNRLHGYSSTRVCIHILHESNKIYLDNRVGYGHPISQAPNDTTPD